MKKLIGILSVVALIVFMHPGVAPALQTEVTIAYDGYVEFFNQELVDGVAVNTTEVGAVVYYDVTEGTESNTYLYQVENRNFNPLSQTTGPYAISRMTFNLPPVLPGDIFDVQVGSDDLVQQSSPIFGGTGDPAIDFASGQVDILFGFPGGPFLVQGLFSEEVTLISSRGQAGTPTTVYNGGPGLNGTVISGSGGTIEGPGKVPEPTTLLLLGSGLVCAAVFRRLRFPR